MHFKVTLLALLLVAAFSRPAYPDTRTLEVSVVDEKGAPVNGLTADEVAVVENGAAATVERIEPDRRPLTLLVLVDSSQEAGTNYRLNVVPAVVDFLNRLPEDARYALWVTGDRPTKLVESSTDPAEGARAMKRVAPSGGNTLFDALAEAGRELKRTEAQRSAVVVVTSTATELSSRNRQAAVKDARPVADVFHAVLFDEPTAPFDRRSDYDYVLGTLADESGGRYQAVLTAMAVGGALPKIEAEIKGQYRITYASTTGKGAKLEVTVARPSAKARVHPRRSGKAE